jgi:hypothetical protein
LTEQDVDGEFHKTKKASKLGSFFVGVARFELTTSWSQTKRDTGLRYTPNFKRGAKIWKHINPPTVIPAGFEPATYCLEGSCSIQLSYET